MICFIDPNGSFTLKIIFLKIKIFLLEFNSFDLCFLLLIEFLNESKIYIAWIYKLVIKLWNYIKDIILLHYLLFWSICSVLLRIELLIFSIFLPWRFWFFHTWNKCSILIVFLSNFMISLLKIASLFPTIFSFLCLMNTWKQYSSSL